MKSSERWVIGALLSVSIGVPLGVRLARFGEALMAKLRADARMPDEMSKLTAAVRERAAPQPTLAELRDAVASPVPAPPQAPPRCLALPGFNHR